MQAVILAGGMGTRLKSVVSDRPKPMAEINGKPFLEYQLRYLAKQGIYNIVLCVGYLGGMIEDYFKDGSDLGVKLVYSYEQEPLGTGGALKNCERYLEQEFILMNGDTYYECDFDKITKFHFKKQAFMTISLIPCNDIKDYGSIRLNADGTIAGFAEKETQGVGYANAGVYILDRLVLQKIHTQAKCSLEEDVIPGLLKNTKSVYGFQDNKGMFIDIGVPERYHRFVEYSKELI